MKFYVIVCKNPSNGHSYNWQVCEENAEYDKTMAMSRASVLNCESKDEKSGWRYAVMEVNIKKPIITVPIWRRGKINGRSYQVMHERKVKK